MIRHMGGQGVPGHVFTSDNSPPPRDPAKAAGGGPPPSALPQPSRQIVLPDGHVRFVSDDPSPAPAGGSSVPAVVGQAADGTTQQVGPGGIVRFVSAVDPAVETPAAPAGAQAAPAPAAPQAPATPREVSALERRVEALGADVLARVRAAVVEAMPTVARVLELEGQVAGLEAALESAREQIARHGPTSNAFSVAELVTALQQSHEREDALNARVRELESKATARAAAAALAEAKARAATAPSAAAAEKPNGGGRRKPAGKPDSGSEPPASDLAAPAAPTDAAAPATTAPTTEE